ncbi:methylated-DNA--[protein]-cysteine S-methyltransferase [Alkalicoccus daliensis]|uniref:Methylated-DNA--protein-cysteine methyltransferase n=1 Tax=Alkalicoccus daliensis TaxID=745820 RepID=A0A1H0I6C9_9BACI|nr:methylated-DNA--[protein]-cysteine S-methyltransferase [Alkalicoccus daliensis]SDO26976.1 methylated-DNA-[protein]-cysteine S-methyltransferase [Alkalicoccus daliensis]
MTNIYYTELSSPIGPLTMASTEKGICNITFGSSEKMLDTLKRAWKKHEPGSKFIYDENGGWLTQGRNELNEFFHSGRRNFETALDLRGTLFQKLVWRQLQQIPYGETRSYKDVAAAIGLPKSVRAVGGANNRNPIPIIIPCHRVIGSNGALVGYGGGMNKKEILLEIEGALHKL